MKNIDLDALNAEVQMAQQTGRKFCSVAVGELTSLLMRAAELKKIQGVVPFKIGWCCPEDVHKMLQGELHQVGLRRRKGSKYRIEVLVQSLPDGQRRAEKPVAAVEES
jgi:hypothetical protein